MKKLPLTIIALLVLAIGSFVIHKQESSSTAKKATTSSAQIAFNKKQLSIDDPTSIWIIVNKLRPLDPESYMPGDLVVPSLPLRLSKDNAQMKLRQVAANALVELDTGAKKDNLHFMVSSAYRSYNYQTSLYSGYVKKQGKVAADSQSARPGHSEHQTGLAVDLEPVSRKCEVESCFGDLAEGKWLASNAYKYGFVIRYPKDGQSVTGYIYEPWHIRYVGKTLATEIHTQGNPTLEKFFGLSAAPDYK